MFYKFLRKYAFFLLGSTIISAQALQTTKTPTRQLRVGARNSAVRNIGVFQVDSALVFPKRLAKDTLNSNALKQKGAFFYDSVTHIVWFFDGTHFRRADSSIYNSNGKISEIRTVDIDGKNKAHLLFKGGAVIFDTLLVKNPKLGNSTDSLLVVRNDSVYSISRDSLFNIYNKSDSIKENRIVTLRGRNNAKANVYFKDGQFSLDTLLIKQKNLGTSKDSFLVRYKDTVRYIPFDSLRSIYFKDDSIRTKRTVTLKNNQQKSQVLHFAQGSVHIDTLLLPFLPKDKEDDSVLTIFKDTVRKRKLSDINSVKSIYSQNDSIKEKRVVTLADKTSGGKKLHFTQGSVHIDTLLVKARQGFTTDSFLTRFKDTVRYVSADSLPNIYNKDDTLKGKRIVNISKKNQHFNLQFKGGAVIFDTLLVKNRKLGNSFDSLLVVRNDSVYRISRDSLFNIYNKSDSIKENRIVTLRGRNNAKANVYFKDGQFLLDTLLIRQKNKGTSKDSFLVRFKDTVRYIPFDSLRTIYNVDDSIKKDRVVTLRGKNNAKSSVYFKDGQFSLDTLLIKQKNLGTSKDSFLVRYKDTVRYIPFDSLRSIYFKDDSIRTKRTVTLKNNQQKSQVLHFAQGSVHIDTLLVKARQGFTTDSFLTRFHDTVRYITADSLPNIYNKNGAIKEKRVVKIDVAQKGSLSFTGGRVEIDTLLVRKRRLGKAKDSFLTVWKDTVRSVPFDSLWNIYSKDDSIRNTGRDNKRKVFLNNKQLIFINQNNSANNVGRIGILQDNPLYSLDIATASFMKNKTNGNSNSDSIAVRISHNVRDGQLNYGLLLSENSNKATGKSAIGFEGGHGNTIFKKAAIWAQVGSNFKRPLFGINTADSSQRLRERLLINHEGNVKIGDNSGNDNFPARLVVNTVDWTGGMDIGVYDPTNYNRRNVAILANVGSSVHDAFKYGLVIRENVYNAGSKVGVGFYNGGWGGGQAHSMTSRIWGTSGAGAWTPKFGIDVSSAVTAIGQSRGFRANLITRMVIDQNGNVGMGTTEPKTNLDIQRENNNNVVRVRAGRRDLLSGLWLTTHNSDSGFLVYQKPQDTAMHIRFTLTRGTTGSNGDQFFPSNNNNNQTTEILTIKGARKTVGILNSSPQFALDIQTNSFRKNKTSANSNGDSIAVRISHNVEENKIGYGLLLSEQSNKASGRSAIGFEGGITTNNNRMFKKAAIWAQNGSNFKRVLFGISTADSNQRLQTRMVINDSGFVGIGVEAPEANVDIARAGHSNYLRVRAGNNGNNKYAGVWLTVNNSKQGWQIRENSQNHSLEFCPTESNGNNCSGQASGSSNSFNGIFFSKNGTGSTTPPTTTISSGSNVATIHAPLYASSSDSILKKQIRNLDNSVSEKLLALRPVQYRWKHDTTNWISAVRFGLIAQEVEKIFPNMVLNSQINGQTRKFISYLDLIAPIIKTLQTQENKIDKLQKQVDELKTMLQQVLQQSDKKAQKNYTPKIE